MANEIEKAIARLTGPNAGKFIKTKHNKPGRGEKKKAMATKAEFFKRRGRS
jgi:hypothetical protein